MSLVSSHGWPPLTEAGAAGLSASLDDLRQRIAAHFVGLSFVPPQGSSHASDGRKFAVDQEEFSLGHLQRLMAHGPVDLALNHPDGWTLIGIAIDQNDEETRKETRTLADVVFRLVRRPQPGPWPQTRLSANIFEQNDCYADVPGNLKIIEQIPAKTGGFQKESPSNLQGGVPLLQHLTGGSLAAAGSKISDCMSAFGAWMDAPSGGQKQAPKEFVILMVLWHKDPHGERTVHDAQLCSLFDFPDGACRVNVNQSFPHLQLGSVAGTPAPWGIRRTRDWSLWRRVGDELSKQLEARLVGARAMAGQLLHQDAVPPLPETPLFEAPPLWLCGIRWDDSA